MAEKCSISPASFDKLKDAVGKWENKEKLIKWFTEQIRSETSFDVDMDRGMPVLILETTWGGRVEYYLKPHEVEEILQI